MKQRMRRGDLIAGVVLITVFVMLIAMNSTMIIGLMMSQISESGQTQIGSIRSDFESTLTESESVLTHVASGAEQIMKSGDGIEALDEYIRWQKTVQIENSGGAAFNVYIAGHGWEIIPDFDMPADYHATERSWYAGAAQLGGDIYITEPYIDSMTGNMCFTMSVLLSDGDTVVSIDYTLSRIQQSIRSMGGEDNNTAMIVTADGLIVGYTDMSRAGEELGKSLPDYTDVFESVLARVEESGSFSQRIAGTTGRVFYTKTRNNWYMILFMDIGRLYGVAFRNVLINIIISIALLAFVSVFYVRSSRNRAKAEEALKSREIFVSRLSQKLREPLKNILEHSDAAREKAGSDVETDINEVKASGLRLNEMIEDLGSYSSIISDINRTEQEEKKKKNILTRSIRVTRDIIIAILALVTVISSVFFFRSNDKVVKETISGRMTAALTELKVWETEKKSVLNMFTDVISANPALLDDYESAVEWMDTVVKGYPDISVCYMANPYKEHTVIMNNGWQPDADWKVEEREWYIKTETSPSGYSISAPYFDEQTGGYCITMSKVVYGKNGEYLGVFGLDLYLEELIKVFGGTYSREMYAFTMDSNGDIINHPSPQYQMSGDNIINVRNTVYGELFREPGVSDYQSEVRVMRDYDGRLSLCVLATDAGSGFSVILSADYWSHEFMSVVYSGIFVAIAVILSVIVGILLNTVIKSQARLNKQLEEAVEHANAAGRAKSEFLAQMSHEIRTPINAVIGMDEMIIRETSDEQILDYAQNIKNAGGTLLRLVNSILDFSKIESGKMEIICVRYDTLTLIDDLVNLVQEKAQEKNLELITDIDPNLPKTLFGDDVRVKQVITNILSNAVKYTAKGSVTLRMHAGRTSANSCTLAVSVEDTGIGIKQEDREKLFDSFRRLDERRNRNIEGTGLGMSIVQGLLAMMNSSLNMESEYGKGSKFSFEIEQAVIDSTPIGRYETGETALKQTGGEKRQLKIKGASILAVDDNEMNLKVIRGLLSRSGADVDLCMSGQDCLQMAGAKHYDVILMDHMMPGMDGIETLNALKASDLVKDSAVIALTANAVAGARDEYMKAGFVDYMTKPIDPALLEKLLARYLPQGSCEWTDDGGECRQEEKKSFVEKLSGCGFNVSAAMGYAMDDEEFYLELLNTFLDEKDKKEEQIRKAYSEGRTDDYRIYVHALKSSSRTIGADKLADMALAQENAAKQGDDAAISEGVEPLMSKYSETAHIIREALGGT